MKIKVCGMRNQQNITQLVELHPDYMGFIFYPKSERYVGDGFNVIDYKIPDSINKVAVLVNQPIETIIDTQKFRTFDFLQLHGNETVEYCKKLKDHQYKIIKAFGVSQDFDFKSIQEYIEVCDFLLFDTKCTGFGGSGQKFDWSIFEKYPSQKDFFLSGGIDLEDIEAIKSIKNIPIHAIDINSRFETKPALKNIEKVKTFISELRNC